jgi:hypothetical protein
MLHPEPLRRPSASKVLLQAIVLLVRATPNAGAPLLKQSS